MKSLRRRLQLSLSLTLLLMLVLFALGTGLIGERLMQQLVASRLADDSETLLARLQWDAAGRLNLADHHLAGAFQRAYSGHYYILQVDGEAQRSRSLWEQRFELLPLPPAGEVQLYNTEGPLQQRLLVRMTRYRKQGHDIGLWLAEDMTPHYAPLKVYYLSFAIMAALTLLLLWWLQRLRLTREFRRLEQVAEAVAQMKHGELRRLSEEVPEEVLPLVREVNQLSGRLEQRIERTRHALGNLAHALKTPMTLLQQLSEQAWWQQHPQQLEGFQQQLQQIRSRMDEELKRARIIGSSRPAESFAPARHLPALVETIKRVHYQKPVQIELHIPQQVMVGLSRDDMLELLGNLLDNAFTWARQQVVCRIEDDDPWRICIEDDGPGVEAPEKLLEQRGVRLDEQQAGHGLGLAIVKEIVDVYGGRIELTRSPDLGGLRVEIGLPRSQV